MVWLRHVECKSPIVEYRGTIPLAAGVRMRQQDWFDKDGEPSPRRVKCHDCEKLLWLSMRIFACCDSSDILLADDAWRKRNNWQSLDVATGF